MSIPFSVQTCPQPDVDLMVTEEVVKDWTEEEVVVMTSAQPQQPVPQHQKVAKILLIISDDLCYTLDIRGDSLSALIDSVTADEQLKSEWHLWHRFITNPDQFFVYIFDTDFGEYVRHRESTPIRHLSKIKIKNKFYVSQSLNSSYNQFNGQSLDCLDTEPTDALIGDQYIPNSQSSEPSSMVTNDNKTNNCQNSTIVSNHNSIQTSISSSLNTSQYHHNYHMSSPSAPMSTQSSTTPSHTISSCPSAPESQSIQSKTPKLMTKATKKLFINSTSDEMTINDKSKQMKRCLDDSPGSDLLADAPTGPTYDWSEEQTVTYLEMCQKFIKELAPKKNVLEVKPNVWEQLAKDLNSKDFGSFDALMCRNHFSRLRLTYTNILCYPALVSETRWPYFDLMKAIIGERPVEMQTQVKTRAQSAKLVVEAQKSGHRLAAKRSHRKPSGSIMKNSANQEVSELYVALLNLVKKYMKYFETEKKNKIWNRIEKEMNGAGYKWNAISLRALFHRLRYNYLNILRSVGDEELATASWPYFRYFQGLDLSAFRTRKKYKKSLKAIQKGPEMVAKRRPGRPRKHPVVLNKTGGQLANGGAPVAANQTVRTVGDESDNGMNCEVSFIEYSDDQSSGSSSSGGSSDVEGVENKKKVKSE